MMWNDREGGKRNKKTPRHAVVSPVKSLHERCSTVAGKGRGEYRKRLEREATETSLRAQVSTEILSAIEAEAGHVNRV